MGTENISGYCLLSMPSDQVQPLGLLSFKDKGEANITGVTISDLFIKSEVALPLISNDYNLSSDLNKAITMEVAVDSHLSLLEGLLNFLHLSASFNLQKNKSVKINMLEAKKNNVNEFKLDAYINTAQVNKISPTYTELLQNNQLYVITDILKCRKYSIEYVNTKSTDTGIKGGAAQMGDVDAGLRTGNTDNDSAVYAGDTYLTLGVKAFRIFYVKDPDTGAESFRIRQDDTIKTVKGDEDFSGELLQAATVIIK